MHFYLKLDFEAPGKQDRSTVIIHPAWFCFDAASVLSWASHISRTFVYIKTILMFMYSEESIDKLLGLIICREIIPYLYVREDQFNKDDRMFNVRYKDS